MREFVLNLDRPRRLRYDFKAIRTLRERYVGKELSDLMGLAIDELPVMAWAGLVWEDPALTPEVIETMLNEKIGVEFSIAGLAELIAGALAAHAGIEPGKKVTSSDGAPETLGLAPETLKV